MNEIEKFYLELGNVGHFTYKRNIHLIEESSLSNIFSLEYLIQFVDFDMARKYGQMSLNNPTHLDQQEVVLCFKKPTSFFLYFKENLLENSREVTDKSHLFHRPDDNKFHVIRHPMIEEKCSVSVYNGYDERTLFNKECYQMEVTALVMHPTMTIYSENSKYYSLSIMVMCYNTCMQVIEYNHLDSIIVEEDRDMFFKQIKEYKTFLINSYTEEMIHSLSNLDIKRVDIF